MNINQNINKLLYALQMNGKFYKINSFQFYNEKTNKYRIKYQILKKKMKSYYNTETEEIENIEKYEVDYDCYSKIDIIKYLAQELKGSEVSEE